MKIIISIVLFLLFQKSASAEVSDKLPLIYSWIPYTPFVFIIHMCIVIFSKRKILYFSLLELFVYLILIFTPLGAIGDSLFDDFIRQALEKEVGFEYNKNLIKCWLIIMSPLIIKIYIFIKDEYLKK